MKTRYLMIGFALFFVCCGNSNSSGELKKTSVQLQRKVYGLVLGETYSRMREIDSLSVYFPGFNDDYDLYGERRYPYREYAHGTSKIFLGPDYPGFLFGGHYWQTFEFNETNDGRMEHFSFYSAQSNTEKERKEFDFLLNTLTEKYGRPNVIKGDYTIDYIWHDGTCQIALGKAEDDDELCMQLDFVYDELKPVDLEKAKEEL